MLSPSDDLEDDLDTTMCPTTCSSQAWVASPPMRPRPKPDRSLVGAPKCPKWRRYHVANPTFDLLSPCPPDTPAPTTSRPKKRNQSASGLMPATKDQFFSSRIKSETALKARGRLGSALVFGLSTDMRETHRALDLSCGLFEEPKDCHDDEEVDDDEKGYLSETSSEGDEDSGCC
mmetsp:Transcript_32596/g.52442  ORF Transcript_32596/g.52442 Transcript_32596/m.52442 type:complete len:175 (+) Transcript_32596:91-615(+)